MPATFFSHVYRSAPFVLVPVCIVLFSVSVFAQRSALGVFDNQRNTIGNVDFFVSNVGIFGTDMQQNEPGCFWPRGTDNTYIFGAGLWFGARKNLDDAGPKAAIVVRSYDHSTQRSLMVPGSAEDGPDLLTDQQSVLKNRVYFSTDFNADGTPVNSADGPAWPLWNTGGGSISLPEGKVGTYVNDTESRNAAAQSGGPVFVSDEDIICRFKDTDLSRYGGDPDVFSELGYPSGLEVEQAFYTWKQADVRDVVIVRFDMHNTSTDTLFDCYIAPVFDADVGSPTLPGQSSTNDVARYYGEDPDLNLHVQWSDVNEGEQGQGYGYIGMSFLETPAVSGDGFLRRDKEFYPREEQLGLTTTRAWTLANEPHTDAQRFDMISRPMLDELPVVGDVRLLMASGPFTMLPGEKTRLIMSLQFAAPAKGGEADGTPEDLANLVDLTKRVQEFFDNGAVTGVAHRALDASTGLQVRVMSDPADSDILLALTSALPGTLSVEVYSMLGELVQPATRHEIAAGGQILNLPAAMLPSGAYFLRLTRGSAVAGSALSLVR